jgi:hypothetical protein
VESEQLEPIGSLRLVDILTTAASIASARNTPGVGVEELLLAVKVVGGEMEIEEVGGAVHPMLIRGNAQRPVQPEVRALIQRWYSELGGTVDSALSEGQAAQFVSALQALPNSDGGDRSSLE